MIRITGPGGSGSNDAIRSVFEQAVAAGAGEPAWVVVEDDAGAWVRQAALVSPEERARAVVAVRTEAALVQAVRLGIGGAMWLPPSTVDASFALAAAMQDVEVRPPALDPWLAELVSGTDQAPIAVTWNHRAFWRCQVGERRMAALLAELAEELEVLPVILPWPALLAPVRDAEEIHSAWAVVTGRRGVISEGISVIPCEAWERHCGIVTSAVTALVDHQENPSRPSSAGFSGAVCELPSGRQVGRWSPVIDAETGPGPGWLATPEGTTAHGFTWRLADEGGGEQRVDDVLSSGAEAGPAIRTPGWLAAEAGPGRPAGLLVERLAGDAQRRGIPLWVPNVDRALVQFLLRLPGVFWVDGPAVPEPTGQ